MAKRPTSRRTGKRQSARLFQFRDQWIGREAGSPNFFRYWYDGERHTRRASLGTPDLEQAKEALIRVVLGDAPKDALAPDAVHMAAVRNFYMERHGNHIRSKAAASRAFELVLAYLKIATGKEAPTVADFGLARQQAWMRWARDEYKLSSKTLNTYLSVIQAATNFCALPRIDTDSKGQECEVQVLAAPFHIETRQEEVCRVTGLHMPEPRQFVPTDIHVAKFLDATYDESSEKEVREREALFRYAILALNLWARPEALLELDVSRQVDFSLGLVNLNPPGRKKTKKHRPVVRLTDNLRGWLLHWNLSRPIVYNGQPVKKLSNKTFGKAAIRAGVPEMVPYSLRHYSNSRSMRVAPDIRPDREERATWMGHHDPRHEQTRTYEHYDPEYLARAMMATDAVMVVLDLLSVKSLFAPGAVRPGLRVVERRVER